MKRTKLFLELLPVLMMALWEASAQAPSNIIQEKESAEVFLEEYTDGFQETFFEALKQKGIQNYDRAINLLLECRQMNLNNNAVNHELAKAYFLDKKYISAQQYAVEALVAEPENYWFLANLIKITEKQGIPFQGLDGNIPYTNTTLKVNLAKIHFQQGKYHNAKKALKGIPLDLSGLSRLAQRINDSITNGQKSTDAVVVEGKVAISGPVDVDVALENFRNTLRSMAGGTDHLKFGNKAKEALEAYPLQPEFYYYRGLALNKMKRPMEAIDILEEGLDYLFGNDRLANDFYKELAGAHKAVGDISKANGYLSKVKTGY